MLPSNRGQQLVEQLCTGDGGKLLLVVDVDGTLLIKLKDGETGNGGDIRTVSRYQVQSSRLYRGRQLHTLCMHDGPQVYNDDEESSIRRVEIVPGILRALSHLSRRYRIVMYSASSAHLVEQVGGPQAAGCTYGDVSDRLTTAGRVTWMGVMYSTTSCSIRCW